MNENKRLERIEEKLDRVLEDHGNRITKIETQAGFIKAGLAFIGSLVIWALNKFYNHT